jgi:hypothetical protein
MRAAVSSAPAAGELLLPTGISGDVFFSIARQVKELSLIDFHSLVALNEATELGLLPIYNSLRNIPGMKSSLEFHPSDNSPRR